MADGRTTLPALRPRRHPQTDEVKAEQWAPFGGQHHGSYTGCTSTLPDPTPSPRPAQYAARCVMDHLFRLASSPWATLHARPPTHVPVQPGVSGGSVFHAPDAPATRQYALRPRFWLWLRFALALPSPAQRGRSAAPVRTHALSLLLYAASHWARGWCTKPHDSERLEGAVEWRGAVEQHLAFRDSV